jgi:TfoX/Sxy family transcriptional regulator of competence genes
MPWSKSPQVLMDLFAECLPDEPGIERRKMFGYPVAFVNGNMFAGLFGDGLFARVPPDLRARLERDHGAKPFEPMAGRPMKDYLAIPDAVIADEEALAAALMAAFMVTKNLPPKLKKARKP